MKRLLLSLFALLAMGCNLQAQVTVTNLDGAIAVDDVEISPGGEATITFKLTKLPDDGKLRALQFDLYLPTGFSLAKTKKGAIISEISEDQTLDEQEFSVSASTQGNDQHIRFIFKSEYMPDLSQGYDYDYLAIGDIFSVTLKAASTVVSSEYTGIVAGGTESAKIDLSGKDGSTTYVQDPVTFNIKMPIVLSEEESYAEGFGNHTDVTVTMDKRTLKADTWNTICLPFAMNAKAMKAAFGENNQVTIATLSGCSVTMKDGKIKDIIIKFDTKSTSAISANTPCLIKLSEGVETFSVEHVSVIDNMTPPSVSGDDCTFYGNYDIIENLGEDTPVMFISGNQFYYATGNTRMKSFRGYFTHPQLAQYIQEHSQGANISIFVDGEPTGIRNIVTSPGNENVYDISGRKINGDKTTLQKGVYIVNGKKEAVH